MKNTVPWTHGHMLLVILIDEEITGRFNEKELQKKQNKTKQQQKQQFRMEK